ncbi:hypothetical protein PCC8801_2535 [Rippkaea orientalis PCC 8801]|uniref:Uncharacterized protein n=1 Tax=Rippkaea orientalis (strain PCC 8801 / RF-1) TaxID=41431 RepID=B7K403_RIPO1|nr:hypothetical protein [Rippkaea orientalis]ACK66543.1 hypothetical protein PCC8801_2535 [Rippkaea orientalis PCC 8801]
MSFVQSFFFSITHCSLFSLGILISLGLINLSPVQAVEKNVLIAEATPSREVSLTQRSITIPNGVYLYGRSPKPETLGQEYLVFKVQEGQVIGAFYMPRSEFSCFSGSFNSRQMNLSIADPYDGTKYDYAIALEPISPIADQRNATTEMRLEGYYRLNNVTENDHRILKTCLSDN